MVCIKYFGHSFIIVHSVLLEKKCIYCIKSLKYLIFILKIKILVVCIKYSLKYQYILNGYFFSMHISIFYGFVNIGL